MKRKYARVATALALSLALVASFMLVGCGGSKKADTPAQPSKTEISIFAANSLQKALPKVQELYTAQNADVTFADTQFEASGTLVTKLKENTAAADILITASKKTMDNAVSNGSVDESTRFDMFANDLVICTSTANPVAIESLAVLTSDAITSIAIGEPNAVPAGKYALQTLASAGLATYDEADDGTVSNIVYADSIAAKVNAGADKVGTVASYVKEGTCQVGFVYSSDIYRYDGISVAFTTAPDSHKSIIYPGAVSKGAKNAAAAKAFLEFCTTNADAVKIFQEYGFEVK